MTFLRRHLAIWSLGWLLCQAAAVAAFLPLNCCSVHDEHSAHGGAPHSAPQECLDATSAEECPLGADGQPCPMHAPAPSSQDMHAMHHQAPPASAPVECTMRGTCNGPALALSTLFALPGIMPAPATATPLTSTSLTPALTPDAPSRAVGHDTPPPKA